MDKLKVRIYLVALIALVLVAAIAMRLGIRQESRKWYGALFASDFFPPLNGFPTSANADERSQICKGLEDGYQFRMSTLHPDHSALYGLPGSRYTLVTIYGITSQEKQHQVIEVAERVRLDENTRPFVIEFYAKETGPSPRDQFLRKVRID
jgi:hypothetical protein